MNKIKLCIFDMDGLLLDTERHVWFVGEKQIAKEFGKEVTDDFLSTLMGLDLENYSKALKNKLGDDFPTDLYSKKIQEFVNDFYKNKPIPFRPGALELLDFLKSNNILISLGTSSPTEIGEAALKKSGIYDYFDYIVYGDQVERGKPHPDIYLKSVNHFNLKPEECFVFEDSSAGAESAYAGNINLIMVPDLKKPSEKDKKMAYAIISSLQEAIPIIKKINNI